MRTANGAAAEPPCAGSAKLIASGTSNRPSATVSGIPRRLDMATRCSGRSGAAEYLLSSRWHRVHLHHHEAGAAMSRPPEHPGGPSDPWGGDPKPGDYPPPPGYGPPPGP